MKTRYQDPDSDITSVDHVDERLASLEHAIQRLEPLIRTQAYATALEWLPGLFRDGKELLAYDLSDGNRGTREIARLLAVDQKTVSNWWRTWHARYNIVEKAGKRGQFRGRFSFAELIALYGRSPYAHRSTGQPTEER